MNLKWDNIQDDKIVLRRTETKQKKEKVIPITEGISAILNVLHRESSAGDYVIPIPNRQRKVWVKWMIKKIRELSGVKDFVFHGLRHTASSIMVSEALGRGVGLADVMKILGHSQVSTTLRYLHDDFGRMKTGMTALEDRLKK